MKYKFRYRYPFSRKVFISIFLVIQLFILIALIYKGITSIMHGSFSINTHTERLSSININVFSLLDFVFNIPNFIIFFLFLLHPFFIVKSQIKTYWQSRKYTDLVLDKESIVFPFTDNGSTMKWYFKDIAYLRFAYCNRTIIQYNYIEIVQENRIIRLSKSWMKCHEYDRLSKFLVKQNIPVKGKIPQ